MFGGGASMALASIWTSIANWSTPTILFCFLNIMIATIFISSNFNHHHHHHNSPSHQLTRSPSLLERVKSVNLSSLYTSNDEHRVDDSYETTTGYNSVSQLSRAPSLLQRVKSIDLSFSYFHISVPTTESEQLDKSSTSQLTRAPSLLDRVKSLKLSSPFINSNTNLHFNDTNSTSASQDEHSGINPHHDDLVVEEEYDHDYVTSNNKFKSNRLANVSSEKEKRGLRRAGSINVLKSRSEKGMMQQVESEEEEKESRRPETMRESSSVVVDSNQSGSTCVDAKADDFIKRFKQQLKLQRIDSLQRFREMLNRGT